MRNIRTLGFIATISWLTLSAELSAASRSVMVHLFEWPWQDIARECEMVLGPAGVAAVQVSPPQEHAVIDFSPWWQRYQPVSYQLKSRSGNREEFIEMVNRCEKVGVHIYVDAVLNHMSFLSEGVGSGGYAIEKYSYPFLYSDQDFHNCRHGINNGGDRWQVHNCDLATAPDLATETEWVRSKLSGYLQDLINIGVKGFRLDGAKHIPAQDLEAIFAKTSSYPYIFQEVIDFGSDIVSGSEYFGIGDVTEFRYSANIANTFRSGRLSWLENFGTAWGMMPGYFAVVFVDNHDNQRGHGVPENAISFKDGSLHELANIFMLAFPYGYPRLMSSYEFNHGDQGPPSFNAKTLAVLDESGECTEGWICEHRKKSILGMIRFRNIADTKAMSHWWTNGNDQIAFGRESSGFVAINREEENRLQQRLATGMKPGLYCDVISGRRLEGKCTGKTVEVTDDGSIDVDIGALSALAIHEESFLSKSK